MTTVSTAEAVAALPDLMARSRHEKIAIRDGAGDLVYLVSSEQIERERRAKVDAFRESCRLASEELAKNLAAEGISVDEFMNDVLKDL